jgi:peptidoglycan/xylan/chitin deacetylase (PgdA/CDA1 family)
MREMADALQGNEPPERGLVALTFDDGTLDHLTVLPGILEEHGVPGTVYVCPGRAGEPYPWADEAEGVRFLTLDELVELDSRPLIEIGAHTNEHHVLGDADGATALAEMIECKETLEGLLGSEVVSFCYPRCEYSEAAREAAPRAGYSSAVTCGLRGSWHPFELKREVLHSGDGPLVTRFKLAGRYSALGPGLVSRGVRGTAILIDRLVGFGSRPSS